MFYFFCEDTDNLWIMQDLLAEGFFHEVHRVGFRLLGYVYVGFHGLIVGVACEFHHHLRGHSNGEHEADEGLSATVGADLGVFGPGDVVALAFAEAGDMDGLVEAAELADLLDVQVEFLVGDDGQGKVSREVLVYVLVQNGLGVGVELDFEPGVGLLGNDGDGAVLHVIFVEVGHVGVPEAGEGAKAEEVAGSGEGSGLLDFLLVFAAGHVLEFDFLAAGGDLVIVKGHQFIVGEEDDGLGRGLEDRVEFGDVRKVGVIVVLAPVEEGSKVLVLLADGGVLQLCGEAEVVDEFVEALLIEVAEGHFLAELAEVGLEGLVGLGGLQRPADFAGACLEIFVHVAVGGALLGVRGGGFGLGLGDSYLNHGLVGLAGVDGGDAGLVLADGLVELQGKFFDFRAAGDGHLIVGEMLVDVLDAGVDGEVVLAQGICVALLDALLLFVPLVREDGKADALHHTGATDADGNADGGFACFIELFLEVEVCFHMALGVDSLWLECVGAFLFTDTGALAFC